MEEKVKTIINSILANADQKAVDTLHPKYHLRNDLGFDSLMLAELTVHIEEEFGVDVFEDGIINTIEEVFLKIKKGQ